MYTYTTNRCQVVTSVFDVAFLLRQLVILDDFIRHIFLFVYLYDTGIILRWGCWKFQKNSRQQEICKFYIVDVPDEQDIQVQVSLKNEVDYIILSNICFFCLIKLVHIIVIQCNMYSKQSLNKSKDFLASKSNTQIASDASGTQLYKVEKKKARSEGLGHLYNNDYKPASYKKACQFRDSLSYKKKISENTYKQLELFEDTNELKAFGLGPYFFIEFQRRIVWLFLILSIIEAIRIYINIKGTGLSDYKGTFGSYLVSTTIGNYSGSVLTAQYDPYIMSIVPCAVYLIFFLFYLWWKCHYAAAMKEEDESRQFVKPQKFCVEVEGFDPDDDVKEHELEELFSAFGPVYEVSLAREYAGNLQYFEELDALEEEIKQEELEIILGSGDQQNLKLLKKQKDELAKYVTTLRIKPSVRSAYIHFQFQKSKVEMLQYYSDHYLFNNKNSHGCFRATCCCCIDDPQPKYLYKGKKLYVKNERVPEPEDINWDSYEVSFCGKIIRILISTVIILVFLAVSCTIIGLCSIYISSHSVSCENVYIAPDLASARVNITTTQQKKCYCTANFVESISNQQIKSFCGELINQVYTEQGIQYAITLTSTIVNIIFGVVVHKLVNLTQPQSLSTGYLWKSSISTIFLIFNTVFLPLLIYADIFGFKATTYVSFLTIASTDIRSFLQVQSIKLYVDFQKIWYRNVSPVFVNYLILDIILTWVFMILYRCCCTKQSLQSKQGTILQKNMNEKIISWKLNASDQYAYFNLVIFLALFYSGGIPVLVPLGFVSLFSKYVSNRTLLQSLSTRIDGLSQYFNGLPFTLVPILLFAACLMGDWMITANSLLYSFQYMKITITNLFNWDILNRLLIFPFFPIGSAVVLVQFLFYNTIIRFCSWLSQSCYDKKQVVHPYYTRQYAFYAKSMSILHSYNIRNNLKYKNAIINLEKYLDYQDQNGK